MTPDPAEAARSARRMRVVLALLVAGMAAYCAMQLRVGTDITNFLPVTDREVSALSALLTDSELTRTVVICLSRDGAPAFVEAAGLAERLRAQPGVAFARAGVEAQEMRHAFELYFPRRHLLMSRAPEREIPGWTTREALSQRAEEVRGRLAGPTAPLLKRVVPEDPLGAFERLLERMRAEPVALRSDGGRFVSRDGAFAVVVAATDASPFDSGVQAPLVDLIDEASRALAADGVVVERSGTNLFALDVERQMRGDVVRIGVLSFLGVAGLFLFFFRRPTAFALAMLPGLVGILFALTLGLALWGELDGLTIAFGASLVGVAIDYPIHLLMHHGLDDEDPRIVVARLRPSLVLGAATTMASFAGLALTAFPGLREIAFLAVLGIAGALATTLFALPRLITGRLQVPARTARVARALVHALDHARRRQGRLWAGPVLGLVVLAAGLPHLRWNDDLSSLTTFSPELVAEDARVRERVSRWETSRVLLSLSDGDEQALERSLVLRERLEPLVEAGALEGYRSIESLLWPAALQRRNWQVLSADAGLAARVAAAFEGAGFREGTTAPFAEHLAGPAPEPLTLSALRTSPLAPMVRPLVFPVGERVAGLTYLRELHDERALAAAIEGLDGVRLFDQQAMLDEFYGAFRAATLRQIAVGSLLVALALLVRYRRPRPVLAALLPSLLTAAIVLATFGLLGVETHLIHVVSLMMVMGMGVDYGIFLVDSAGDTRHFEATLLSLVLACGTTVFVFGTLALSSHGALHAMGATTGLGVLLSLVLAPLALLLIAPPAPAPSAPPGRREG